MVVATTKLLKRLTAEKYNSTCNSGATDKQQKECSLAPKQ